MKDGQKGAVVIMEAAFVFPIMFFVIFILLMVCEGYYQYARVERACIVAAVQGAARCENPMLETVQKSGQVPTSTTAAKVRPYRYIFTEESKQIAAEMEAELERTIANMDCLAFRGMTPDEVEVDIDPRLNVLVSAFPVECKFKIQLPIRMIFSNEDLTFHYEVTVVQPIGDPAEFVRNVSTVQDYLDRNATITEYLQKIRDAFAKISRFIN